MNLLDQGAAWLLEQTQAAAGIAMTYQRGGDSQSVTAVRSSRAEIVNDENGIPVQTRRHALVISASELGFEPRAGDRITESIGGVDVTWEVLPPAEGEPSFTWWDRAQTAYLIDVTQVGA